MSILQTIFTNGGRDVLRSIQGVIGTYNGASVTFIPGTTRRDETILDENAVCWDIDLTLQVGADEIAAPTWNDTVVYDGKAYSVRGYDESNAGLHTLKLTRTERQARRNANQVVS